MIVHSDKGTGADAARKLKDITWMDQTLIHGSSKKHFVIQNKEARGKPKNPKFLHILGNTGLENAPNVSTRENKVIALHKREAESN